MRETNMSVEERLNRAGFRRVTKDNDTCCALCNYYTVTDDTNEDVCELHRVNFGKNFDASGYECGAVDCSRWNNLTNGILEEMKEEKTAANSMNSCQEIQQPAPKEGCYIARAERFNGKFKSGYAINGRKVSYSTYNKTINRYMKNAKTVRSSGY